MSRTTNINWRKSDAEKLTKTVERFNAKIYRTRKNHPELADILPDTIKKTDKMEMINQLKAQPRSEFKKVINSLKRFTKRGAENKIVSATGNRVTRWEKNEVALQVGQINRERTIKRKKVEALEATSRGENLGMKRGEMGSERLNALKPKKFDFDKIRGGKEWELFKESVKRQATPSNQDLTMERYKENYLKGLENFGGYANDIIELIKELPAEYVDEVYYREQEADIKFYYPALHGIQSSDDTLDILRELWKRAHSEYFEKING
jgi:hypothetical protein